MSKGLIVFMRIFLVVFGLIFIGGGGFVILAWQGTFDHGIVYGVIAGLAVFAGFAFVWTGIFAGARTIDGWTDAVTVHEASLIPVIISIPIFLIWACIPSRWPSRSKARSGEMSGDGFGEGMAKRSRRRKRA
ncbi:hypothetical protein SAMN03159496_02200 [Rhizobium sp. NFR07]|uniref:hypothetical protein n=1 Tax=Rhizobium sp. NFR07 TaxID=1566262 RepID=UPI0008E84DE3|nr:hypothetical protein [Rhizobium sp. NFR07]SFB18202.1 hypothetical protein SAMN03159496_02200 [Rhizobium sp. NFR07]